MKKIKITSGFLLIVAAISFWISWFLMPDPGTTDTNHILQIVKESRAQVFYSVIIQIVSSLLFLLVMFLLVQAGLAKKKTLAGIILVGIGATGLCADAFFHLLAYFMTDDSITREQNIVRVMEFMQTKGVVLLAPLLLPFFIGSLAMSVGLSKQSVISRIPALIFVVAFFVGLTGAVIAHAVDGQKGPALPLIVLGMVTMAHVFMGFELIGSPGKRRAVFRRRI